MVIVGYQGIGKSTLAGCNGFIDLESSNFFVDGKRDENWHVAYAKIAISLSQQGYNVFVSSHQCVRDSLVNYCNPLDTKLVIVCPDESLRDQWVAKLEERYNRTKLDKDLKAWKNAEQRYIENIQELRGSEYFTVLTIKDMGYSLEEMLKRFIVDNGL